MSNHIADKALSANVQAQQTGLQSTTRLTAKFAQPNLLPAGDDGVGKVVQAETRWHLQGKVANHEGQKRENGLGALSIFIVWIHRRADNSC